MKLAELEVILDKELKIWESKIAKYCVCFDSVEISDGHFLISASGHGDTKRKAKKDYAEQLAGKTIVVNAYTLHRREFTIPLTLVG